MNTSYVPILKWKRGEQNALSNLSSNEKEKIMPLIEVPFTPSTQKEITINDIWQDRKYYFYLCSDWYDDDNDPYEIYYQQYSKLSSNPSYIIPVFDLSNVDTIIKWANNVNRRIAIRIRNNEFGLIENELNELFDNGDLSPENVDLIMDLKHISADDIFAKTSVLKAAFSDLLDPDKFNAIIIASGSFPKQLSGIDSQKTYHFRRYEVEIHSTALKLAKRHKFKYIYSDYGPSDLEDITFVVGMSPNFKIKYTTFDEYLFIKGISVKRGGLEIDNISLLCKILVRSDCFAGKDYSWGDLKIYELSQNLAKSGGNLTTWVSYSLNHHIALILNQV